MERQTVGTNLTVIRERRMWTQVRLAEEAGVSPTTVSEIETGRISRPHFGTLRRLANALGVDPQALLSPEQSFSAEFNKQGLAGALTGAVAAASWTRRGRRNEARTPGPTTPRTSENSLFRDVGWVVASPLVGSYILAMI
jgi:transcriptional regulator with XRE-family HTH domain